MRWVCVPLLLLFALLQHRLWLGEGGLIEKWALEETRAASSAENARLQERNRRLAAEVKDLKSGLDAVEERARSELGMVKDGEVFYQVVDE
jgi:cell division protein FtsB